MSVVDRLRYIILSIINAKPKIRTIKIGVIKPAPPSINLSFNTWWNDLVLTTSSSTSMLVVASGAATWSVAATCSCSVVSVASCAITTLFKPKVINPASAKIVNNFFILFFL